MTHRKYLVVLTGITALAGGCAPTGVPAAPIPTAGEPPPIRAGVAPAAGVYAPGFDALHYDIAITIPDTGTFVRAASTATIRLEAGHPDTLQLDFTGLSVDAVRVEGRPAGFRHDAGRLRIAVPSGRTGDSIEVEVAYHGHPDDGLVMRRNVHGDWTVFADNWPNRARFWFPSIDDPSDKASVAFTVRASPTRAVIANGERVPGTPRGVWRWVNAQPIPTYAMVIGVAPLVVRRIGGCAAGTACPEVSTWLYPQDAAVAAPSFRRAGQMLAWFGSVVAPFPYAKLAHVESATRFGGMENVSAIFYDEATLSQGRDIEETVAHETAHQWFGDAATEAEWHHLWLSEGFATYFSALFFEHAEGVERFRAIMRLNREKYLASTVVDRPVVDPAEHDLFALLNTNSYQKGAWVLHMLRGTLGDSVFFEGIRRYYRGHEHGTVLTADLQHAFESASGRRLDWFFDQWIYRPGYPRIRARVAWRAQGGSGGVAVVLIEQVQPAGWPTFRTPLTLELETPEGPVRRTAEIFERATEIHIPLPRRPTALRVDPDGWVLATVDSVPPIE